MTLSDIDVWRSSLVVTALALAPACGDGGAGISASATSTETTSTTAETTGPIGSTGPTPTEGSTEATPTEGSGGATEGTGTTATSTTTTDTSTTSTTDTSTTSTTDTSTTDTSTTATSTTDTSTTEEIGESSTTEGPFECPPGADATATPLTDPLSETRLRLFARPDGYHLLYLFQAPEFETHLVKLDRDGEVVGAPSLVASEIWRHTASNGERYAGATVQIGNPAIGAIHVAEIQADDTLAPIGVAELPGGGRGPQTIAVQWNPVDGEWGVLWTEQYDINPNEPGVTHARLYFGRVTADGVWADGSKKLLTTVDTKYSAQISDWANPLIWADDRYAAVWAEYGPVDTNVYLAELTADGEPTRVLIDQGRFSRGVPAWDGVGYGVTWGHWDFDDHFNLRFAYVEGGAVGEALHLGDDQIYSNDASIVAVDDRFTVSWHDTADAVSRVFYATIDPQTLEAETVQVSEPNFAGHDWSWSLVHDGCQYALGYNHGINPSDGWVRLFD